MLVIGQNRHRGFSDHAELIRDIRVHGIRDVKLQGQVLVEVRQAVVINGKMNGLGLGIIGGPGESAKVADRSL